MKNLITKTYNDFEIIKNERKFLTFHVIVLSIYESSKIPDFRLHFL